MTLQAIYTVALVVLILVATQAASGLFHGTFCG